LAVAFYGYVAVVVLRLGVVVHGGMELARIAAGALVLYAGAVALPRVVVAPRRRGTRLLDRRLSASATGRAGFSVVLVLVSAAMLAPLLATADPTETKAPAATRYQPPSIEHPLGTDRLGRDIWSRVLYGARTSLGIAVVAVLLSALIGTVYGAMAGLASPRVDDAMMRVVDGMLAFPRLVFVLVMVALFSSSVGLLIMAIAATGWMGAARLVRTEVTRLRERDFVRAAIATGVGRGRLIVRHLLPNAAGPVIVAATLNVGGVILLESYLSFLGLGVRPPAPSWGSMVYEGREMLVDAWWVAAAPAAAITVAVVAFNMIGDGLRDALETKQ
jgi:peptide/nickel transport system permease protein